MPYRTRLTGRLISSMRGSAGKTPDPSPFGTHRLGGRRPILKSRRSGCGCARSSKKRSRSEAGGALSPSTSSIELCDGNPKLEPVDIEALKAALNDEGINVTDSEPQTSNLSCSFCGKLQSEILQLIAGADAFICDECVQLCVRCIATEHPEWLAELRKLLDDLAGKKGPDLGRVNWPRCSPAAPSAPPAR